MQHVKHSNRNIVNETGRIRNIIWQGEQQILLKQPIIWLILLYLFSYNWMVKYTSHIALSKPAIK